jgi:hypothetical protein
MHRSVVLAISVCAAHLTGACTENNVCLLIAVPVIKIQVRDAESDELITGPIRGTVTDGVAEDSLVPSTFIDDGPTVVAMLRGTSNRAGTYAVHLETAGYQAWDTTGVRVFDDGCQVDAASITARLKRSETSIAPAPWSGVSWGI